MQVSVIIPAYNAVDTIEMCIKSIIGQKKREMLKEIIIIDDGSTDATYKLCKNLSKVEKKIKLISQKNAGVSAARNRGIKEAEGDYILFVDADDGLEEDFLDVLFNCECADLIICPYKTIKDNAEKEYIYRNEGMGKNCEEVGQLIGVANLAYVWGKFYKVSILKSNKLEFDEKISYGEDNLFVLKYCTYINSCLIVNQGFYRYTISKRVSLSKRYVKDLELFCNSYEGLQIELFDKYSTYEKIFREWCPDIDILMSRLRLRNIFRLGSPYETIRQKKELISTEYKRIKKPESFNYMCHTQLDYIFNILRIINKPYLSVLILMAVFHR